MNKIIKAARFFFKKNVIIFFSRLTIDTHNEQANLFYQAKGFCLNFAIGASYKLSQNPIFHSENQNIYYIL